MEFRFTPEQEMLLAEIDAWLRQHLPPPRERPWMPVGPEWSGNPEAADFAVMFNKQLAERGWLTAHWPKEYGGLGLGIMEQVVLREELAKHDAPLLNANGLSMIGPILMLYGTEEQKRRHLPGIAKAEVMWCQGYSEPNAGSDLASLQTRAVKDGDEYVINGSKIWTGHGKGADWMFLLARTDPDAPKHKGITFFLLDMRTAGITVIPLTAMDGYVHFCQEYFEDVRVPQENVVGEVNRGWYVGVALLDFERSGITFAVEARRAVDELIDFQRRSATHGVPSLDQRTALRHRLAERLIEVEVGRGFCYRIASIQAEGRIPNYEASIGKIFRSELNQRIAATGFAMMRLFGQAGEGSRWDDGLRTRYALRTQDTVFPTFSGGSNEIQRNIIATRGLGLPRY